MSNPYFALNHRMLVSDARYLEPMGINAWEDPHNQPNSEAAIIEHQAAVEAFKKAGIKVEQVPSPVGCQDGAFTANWGLTWNGKALLSRLPDQRRAEEKPAAEALEQLGYKTKQASVLFSGQGSALIIGGNRVLVGDGYRNDSRVVANIHDWLGLNPILVRAKPKLDSAGKTVHNKLTHLEDSYFYDIDLAIAVIKPEMIAVCWEALTKEGQAAIRKLDGIEVITVEFDEAMTGFACNLVSTGRTVIISDGAPKLIAELKAKGLQIFALPNNELKKAGGGFRCSSLSLY